MIRRYFATTFLSAFLLLILAQTSAAQGLRPEETLYLKPRVGFSWYLSDTEQSPFNFNLDNWKVNDKLPGVAGLELGYQFNQSSSLALSWHILHHPLIFHYGDEIPDGAEADATVFNSVMLLYRLGGTGRVAPFLTLGGNVTLGNDGALDDPGFGPSLGLGLDVVLSDRMSLVFEWIGNMTFPDGALDRVDAPIVGGVQVEDRDFAPFDVSNAVTLGLKFNFKSAFTPVDVTGVTCPSTLEVGDTGTFTAMYNENATQPVTVTWNFGDGATATGTTATHSFTRAGTFTVTATGENGRASDSESCTVTVTAPVPPEIVTVTANPMTFEVCSGQPVTVQFSVTGRGDEPITYSWNFGDGGTATGATASHVYNQVGTYTATVTATNAAGTTTRSVTINAQQCRTGVCFEITEMNSVFFDRNSSALSEEARAALRENLEILQECPNLCARIEGFAGPGERNAQQLSEDRARAVMQFYTDNGIAATRLTPVGRGIVGGQTTKKEGGSQLRRADTIPMQCEDMR